ncbi:metal-binding protein [Persephonella sp.]
MASGRTHEIINLLFLPGAVYYLHPVNFEGFISGYIIGTFFLSPDNDIYHSKPNKRWGVLRIIWYPYTRIFSHRGISHIPFFGTVTKIIYLASVSLIFLYLTVLVLKYAFPDFNIDIINEIKNTNIYSFLSDRFVFSFIFGLFLAEMVHIFTDFVYSTLKRFKIIGKG